MVLHTATKDENVPRPRTLIMVAARDRGRATLGSRTRPELLKFPSIPPTKAHCHWTVGKPCPTMYPYARR